MADGTPIWVPEPLQRRIGNQTSQGKAAAFPIALATIDVRIEDLPPVPDLPGIDLKKTQKKLFTPA